MYSDLINLGLHPRKSLTINLPDVPKRYMSHFIRGYFDGDGCINLYRNKNRKGTRLTTIFVSGSKNFLISLNNFLKENGIVKETHLYLQKRAFNLRYSTKK